MGKVTWKMLASKEAFLGAGSVLFVIGLFQINWGLVLTGAVLFIWGYFKK